MKEAATARALWTRLRADLGNVAFDRCAMHSHPVYPDGPSLIDMLERRGKRYGTILEIGTFHAAGSAVLACFADQVLTIDIKGWPEAEPVLNAAGAAVAEKIVLLVVKDNAEKKLLVDSLDFEMAFIDGEHHAAEFKIDFDLCKRRGLLLCHDYPTWKRGIAGPGTILDAQTEGTLEADPPFVWWTKK